MRVKKTPELSVLCHKAKNLYNYANWWVRECLKWISPDGKRFWFRERALRDFIRWRKVFRAIPPAISANVIKRLDESWKSFFGSIKKWKTSREDFLGMPKVPHFLKRNGETAVYIDYTSFSVQKDGSISFAKDCIPPISPPRPVKNVLKLTEPKKDDRRATLCQIRVLPRADHYIYEFVYDQPEAQANVDVSRILGIDLGVNNIVTCITNDPMLPPFVVNDKRAKSTNQFYNKQRANYSSIKDSQGYKFETKRMRQIADKRNRKVKDFFHKVARYVVNYCVEHKIGRIVIGYNQGWKQEVELGKRNNQNFVQLPYLKIKEMITYKAKLVGIQVDDTEEAHTSKCSAIDNESIEHHDNYLGKRLKRALFSTARGILVHADVNGAANIILKVVPNAFAGGIGGIRLCPNTATIEPRAKAMTMHLDVAQI